jgi:uncharacterized protein YneF (UPF0154 family)
MAEDSWESTLLLRIIVALIFLFLGLLLRAWLSRKIVTKENDDEN